MSFIPVHQLLSKMSASAWNHTMEDPDYASYISSLITAIKSSQSKRILIISKDRYHFLAGFLAALHAGVPVVLPQSDTPGHLKDIIQPEDCLLSDQAELSDITSRFITLNNTGLVVPNNISSIDPSKATIIFYTSGSTGSPKPIVKSLKQLEAEIKALQNTWGAGSGTFLSTVPHHHIYGLLFSLLWPACGGFHIMRQTFAYWEDLTSHCKAEDYIISSPSHLGRFPAINAIASKIFSSGAPLSFEAAQATKQIFGKLPIEVYGSTETGGIAYRQQSGQAQSWTRFKNVELSTGVDQKLRVRSSYLSDDNFYQTEDRVDLIDRDQFRLLGRADRIVKVEGKRICLLELEQKLKAMDYITDSVVLMLDTKSRDELGAIVVLSESGQEDLTTQGRLEFVKNIRKTLSLNFDIISIPRKWRFVVRLPINDQGKSPLNLLQACFREGDQ